MVPLYMLSQMLGSPAYATASSALAPEGPMPARDSGVPADTAWCWCRRLVHLTMDKPCGVTEGHIDAGAWLLQ